MYIKTNLLLKQAFERIPLFQINNESCDSLSNNVEDVNDTVEYQLTTEWG